MYFQQLDIHLKILDDSWMLQIEDKICQNDGTIIYRSYR